MNDLSTIVAAERVIEIKHPVTDQPVGLSITILPDSHPQVRAQGRKALNERLASRGKVTAEKMEQGRIEMIVASIGGWNWADDASFQGSKPEFTAANAAKVLKALPWVSEQIDAELANRTEFFRGANEAAG